MNTIKMTPTMEDIKVKLSILWIFAMLNYMGAFQMS
jgi:hypothetical protein